MRYDPAAHHRRSIRWKGHDYHEARHYFVTLCTQGRLCLFGEIKEGISGQCALYPNSSGRAVSEAWEQLQDRFPNLELDDWLLMPNHLHGIIVLPSDCKWTLYDVVHDFKSWTTTLYSRGVHAGKFEPFEKRLWHRNYFERVIRDESELCRARQYITNNPNCWLEDKLYQQQES
ncbi:transposase [bacterium]|nr:MAG: transposase [bacterium]